MSNPLDSLSSFLESQHSQYTTNIEQCEQVITKAKQLISENTAQILMLRGALVDNETISKHLGELSNVDSTPD